MFNVTGLVVDIFSNRKDADDDDDTDTVLQRSVAQRCDTDMQMFTSPKHHKQNCPKILSRVHECAGSSSGRISLEKLSPKAFFKFVHTKLRISRIRVRAFYVSESGVRGANA